MHIIFPMLSIRHHGGVRVILYLANYLTQRGYRVSLIVPKDRFAPRFSISKEVKIIFTPQVGNWGILSHMLALFFLAIKIKRGDIIVPSFFPTFYVALWASYRYHMRLIYLVQGVEDLFYQGILGWAARITYYFPCETIVVANYLKKRLQNFNSGRKIMVINPGLPDGIFYPDPDLELTQNKKAKAILFIYTKAKRENLKKLIPALSILERENVPFELWLIVPERLPLKELKVLKSQVRVFTPKDDEELRKIYSSADLFASTSRIEGFLLPPLEAMACSLPCIAADSLGIRDYARDGVNLLLIKENDPQLLAFSIERVIKDNPLRETLKREGLQTSANFSLTKMAEEFVHYLATS